jgi:hypothetical protein
LLLLFLLFTSDGLGDLLLFSDRSFDLSSCETFLLAVSPSGVEEDVMDRVDTRGRFCMGDKMIGGIDDDESQV